MEQDEFEKAVSDLSRRLRVLEERYTTIRSKSQIADSNLLEAEREMRSTFERLSKEITELRRMLVDIDDKMDRLLERAKKAAKRQEVLVLKKYMELWDPLQYLTHEEAQRLLRQ